MLLVAGRLKSSVMAEDNTPEMGLPPEGMNAHLQPAWYQIANGVKSDRQGIVNCRETIVHLQKRIEQEKKTVDFLNERILVQRKMLWALGEIR